MGDKTDKAEVGRMLCEFFGEAVRAQTVGEWDSVLIKYVRMLTSDASDEDSDDERRAEWLRASS